MTGTTPFTPFTGYDPMDGHDPRVTLAPDNPLRLRPGLRQMDATLPTLRLLAQTIVPPTQRKS